MACGCEGGVEAVRCRLVFARWMLTADGCGWLCARAMDWRESMVAHIVHRRLADTVR